MPSRDQLHALFSKTSQLNGTHMKAQLSHAHMEALADLWDGWTMDEHMTPEQSATVMGWAEGLRELADKVGPSWKPPEPEKQSLVGWMARTVVGESTAGKTPSSMGRTRPC